MRRGFGIRVVPCRFRQDNRDFYIDHSANTISDALTSVKHVGRRVADALYQMRGNEYGCFTDLLYAMRSTRRLTLRSLRSSFASTTSGSLA